MVNESLVAKETVHAKMTCHSQPSMTVNAPISFLRPTVSSTKLNPTGVYTREHVIALLKKLQKANPELNRGDKEGWIQHKYKKQLRMSVSWRTKYQ